MVTSSPITSTSGLLKCFNATRLARHAQSRRFPESARQCTVRRRCHTYRKKRLGICNVYGDLCKRTLCPAKMHRDSLSTVSLLLITLSSIRVIVTSSSEGLLTGNTKGFKSNSNLEMNAHTYRPSSYSLEAIGESSE